MPQTTDETFTLLVQRRAGRLDVAQEADDVELTLVAELAPEPRSCLMSLTHPEDVIGTVLHRGGVDVWC